MWFERPVILVTGPDRGGYGAWLFTRLQVILAGGRALLVTPNRNELPENFQGLILGGGADVHPDLYGQERLEYSRKDKPRPHSLSRILLDALVYPFAYIVRRIAARANAFGIDPARDSLEIGAIREALEKNLPILGICRGEQLLNVYFGGCLHQELAGFYVEEPEIRTILPRKRITVEEGTHLETIMGREPGRVNGLHRQGVNRLGTGIRVAARDRNRIVQAIEHETFPFVIGVQWHPEYLPHIAEQRSLFRALVREAAKHRAPAPVTVHEERAAH